MNRSLDVVFVLERINLVLDHHALLSLVHLQVRISCFEKGGLPPIVLSLLSLSKGILHTFDLVLFTLVHPASIGHLSAEAHLSKLVIGSKRLLGVLGLVFVKGNIIVALTVVQSIANLDHFLRLISRLLILLSHLS